jgi:hypothetical protein
VFFCQPNLASVFLNSVHNYSSVTVAGYGSNDIRNLIARIIRAFSTSELKFIGVVNNTIAIANFNSFFSKLHQTDGCFSPKCSGIITVADADFQHKNSIFQ